MAEVTREQLEALVEKLPPTDKPKKSSSAKAKTVNGRGQLTEEQITDALIYVGEVDDRQRWLAIGCALKSELGEKGRPLWDSWSQRSQKFDAVDQDKTWQSIEAAGGITIGTLIKFAQDGGWIRPSRAHTNVHRYNGSSPNPSQDDAIAIPAWWQPPSPDFQYDKEDAAAMLEEVLRRFSYLKEMDNVVDLDDCIIRSMDGLCLLRSEVQCL
jgi:hypothetical protein